MVIQWVESLIGNFCPRVNMWVGNWLGMVVPVCNLRQAESRGEKGSRERGREGLKGILCPKGKQDFSPLIPGNGKFCSLSYSQEEAQTFVLHLLLPGAGVRV